MLVVCYFIWLGSFGITLAGIKENNKKKVMSWLSYMIVSRHILVWSWDQLFVEQRLKTYALQQMRRLSSPKEKWAFNPLYLNFQRLKETL